MLLSSYFEERKKCRLHKSLKEVKKKQKNKFVVIKKIVVRIATKALYFREKIENLHLHIL